ncbi:TPA: hypothetical protein HA244_04905 [Candidatus Micrarchaeota archaeon]|nr:hypothetical protein [Candidatus Micrarchaeota archaeon]
MVSVYVKALVITLVLFAGNYFFVKYLDDSRAQQLDSSLSELQDELQSSRLLLLYSQVFKSPKETCPALEFVITSQVSKLYALSSELQGIESSNLLASTAPLKKKFILENAGLWIYLQQFKSVCGKTSITPILYFYPDNQDCVECRAQAQVLNSIRDECKNVRIFAFPSNVDLGIVNVIKARYSVTANPSIVVNETTFSGLISKDGILGLLDCARSA